MIRLKANAAKQPKIPQSLHGCRILFTTVVRHLKVPVWVCGSLIAPASIHCSCFASFECCAAPGQIHLIVCRLMFLPNFFRTPLKSPAQGLERWMLNVLWYGMHQQTCFSTCRRSMLDHAKHQTWMAAAHVLLFFSCALQGYRWKIYFGAAHPSAEWWGVWRRFKRNLNGGGWKCFGPEEKATLE